jgi:hypothetical protein
LNLLTRPESRSALLLVPLLLATAGLLCIPGLVTLFLLGWFALVHTPVLHHLVELARNRRSHISNSVLHPVARAYRFCAPALTTAGFSESRRPAFRYQHRPASWFRRGFVFAHDAFHPEGRDLRSVEPASPGNAQPVQRTVHARPFHLRSVRESGAMSIRQNDEGGARRVWIRALRITAG